MRKIIRSLIALAVVVPILLLSGFLLWGEDLALIRMKPGQAFGQDSITVPPDFKDDRYWASLPTGKGLANLIPQGQARRSGDAGVDVFYIHPTTYHSGDRWNAPLFANNWSWEMVSREIATQASAFNECCDVYAPHYREATFWSFIERDTTDGHKALEFAYRDVESAFDEFLTRFNKGRPFIIAGHSQGTTHALRLLSERINNSELRKQLVAAYLIGYYVPMDYFDKELDNIPPCESATDIGCAVHWATFGEGGVPEPKSRHYYSTGWEYVDGKKLLCTNPLSWRRDEIRVPASEHTGALAVPADFNLRHMVFNRPSGEKIDRLPAVMPGWTWAQCEGGYLFVEQQMEGPFASDSDNKKRNYHTRDYGLFYQAIRENAVLRAKAHARRY